MHTYIHACMHACMHIYIYTHTRKSACCMFIFQYLIQHQYISFIDRQIQFPGCIHWSHRTGLRPVEDSFRRRRLLEGWFLLTNLQLRTATNKNHHTYNLYMSRHYHNNFAYCWWTWWIDVTFGSESESQQKTHSYSETVDFQLGSSPTISSAIVLLDWGSVFN